MKKTSLFLVLMTAISCISCGNEGGSSSTNNPTTPTTSSSTSIHSHRILTHEGKDATCLEDGWKPYYTCETCDYTTYEVIPALGHEKDAPVRENVQEATCEEVGYEAYDSCENCDYSTYQEIPAKGHTEDAPIKENIKESNCSEGGYYDEVVYCKDCKKELSRTKKLTNSNGHKLVHHEGQNPSCLVAGWEAYDTCENCDYTTYKVIPALGHLKGKATKENVKDSSCTEVGHYDEVVYCERCSTELSRTKMSIEKKAHDTVHVDKLEPTCLEKGHEAYDRCKDCDYTTYQEIPALGHNYQKHSEVKNGVTTIRYVCSRCGSSYGEDCKIETANQFEVDYTSYQYPTLLRTVSNATTSIALSTSISVSKNCTWTLSRDIEGTEVIKTKNMSLKEGHNYAYITVWFGQEEYNTVYYLDIYRLSLFTYTIKKDDTTLKQETIEENSSIEQPEDVTKQGYTFVGWVDENNEKLTFPYIITRDITIRAKWKINQYTISFDTDGGDKIASITQDYGTPITKPENPTKEGHTFAGWDQEIPSIMPAKNMVIKANWTINQYVIIFDTDGGTPIDPITQDYGTRITRPSSPTKEGYTFIGWDQNIPSIMPAQNMTIKAKWRINQYTITFNTNGGTSISSIKQDYGTKITKPNDPTKTGYTFIGWDQEIPETMPAKNIVITAKWDINQYVIIFDTDGGEPLDSISNDYNTSVTLPSTTKEGCSFYGWVDENGKSYEPNEKIKLTKNLQLKAVWVENFEFSKNSDGTIQITKYIGTDKEVVIPSIATTIAANAFKNDTNIEKVTISDTIQSIGNYAFYGCTSLKEINVSSNVKSIGAYAFQECSSLTRIELSINVTSIGTYAFYKCDALIIYCEAKSKPNGWSSSWNYSNCNVIWGYTGEDGTYEGLKYSLIYNNGKKTITITGYEQIGKEILEIPESIDGIVVTTITENAFRNCASLTSVVIPSSVTRIGIGAFEGCSSLESITLPFIGGSESSNQYLGYIFGASSYSDNSKYVPISLKKVIILEGCTIIGNSAFSGCTSLTSVVIPNSVTSIEYDAFYGCTSLTIYCEAESKPSGWSSSWNYSNCPVVWGYKKDQ